jgi:hypothetical protein
MTKQDNILFFKEKLNNLLNDPVYKYKFIVIDNKEIKSIHDTFEKALEFATESLPDNNFIIQQVINEKEQINFIKSAA